ncbi:unnamed protein product [Lymnaea stagnalis]|uniref:C-type lectin domain-containing protein n=1 Tax=Lymnaea stagnalis TaxID=6523 RepID=A0AAV2IFG1_LYMST
MVERWAGWALTWTLMGCLLKVSDATLQAYGCDEGWTNHEEHCYLIVAKNTNADLATSQCQGFSSSLASVWTAEEKYFVLSLWRFPVSDIGFLWLGLRGTADDQWDFDDGSAFQYNQSGQAWSIFTGVSGIPASTYIKCVAFRNSGTVAFLDCGLVADAYVCKKPLPKVFVTASLLNHTTPVATSPLGSVQLFERMIPPVLTTLPGVASYMGESMVSTEVGCAFRCFSLSGCQVFQVSCNTMSNCDNFRCLLFSEFSI